MQMREDWIRMRLWEPQKSGLVLPDGVDAKAVTEEDIFFQVMEVGPDVKEVKIGNVIAVSFMSSDMLRMKLPGEEFKCFAAREGSVIGILRRQP